MFKVNVTVTDVLLCYYSIKSLYNIITYEHATNKAQPIMHEKANAIHDIHWEQMNIWNTATPTHINRYDNVTRQ